jgi:hypothetical protein
MKKLIPLFLVLFLASCEVAQDWLVTTTVKTEQWSAYPTVFKITEKSVTTTEAVLGVSEKQIKEYCAPSYYSEQYGNKLYKYFTTRVYVEQK